MKTTKENTLVATLESPYIANLDIETSYKRTQKITRKDIIEYRNMSKKSWHDKLWHDFMSSEKSQAIRYAESEKEPFDTYKDIAQRAENYRRDIIFLDKNN